MNTELDDLMLRLERNMVIQADYTQRISDIKDEIYQLMNDNNMTSYKTDTLSVSFRGKSLIVTRRPKEA